MGVEVRRLLHREKETVIMKLVANTDGYGRVRRLSLTSRAKSLRNSETRAGEDPANSLFLARNTLLLLSLELSASHRDPATKMSPEEELQDSGVRFSDPLPSHGDNGDQRPTVQGAASIETNELEMVENGCGGGTENACGDGSPEEDVMTRCPLDFAVAFFHDHQGLDLTDDAHYSDPLSLAQAVGRGPIHIDESQIADEEAVAKFNSLRDKKYGREQPPVECAIETCEFFLLRFWVQANACAQGPDDSFDELRKYWSFMVDNVQQEVVRIQTSHSTHFGWLPETYSHVLNMLPFSSDTTRTDLGDEGKMEQASEFVKDIRKTAVWLMQNKTTDNEAKRKQIEKRVQLLTSRPDLKPRKSAMHSPALF